LVWAIWQTRLKRSLRKLRVESLGRLMALLRRLGLGLSKLKELDAKLITEKEDLQTWILSGKLDGHKGTKTIERKPTIIYLTY
jgi:hypothetical protein